MVRRTRLRVLAIAAVTAAAVLATAPPAAADGDLTVSVAGVRSDSLQLTATVASASSADLPKVTTAFAGTTLPTTVEVVQAAATQAEARGVVIVLDTSGSMSGGPLSAARAAALDFAARVPADLEVGLVAVSDTPTVLVKPTRDRSSLSTALNSLTAHGSTALYAALGQAGQLLAGYAQKRMLVLSDGGDNASGAQAPAVINGLVSGKVTVDVVAFRADAAGANALNGLATATGGTVFQAANTAALGSAFQTAASSYQLRLLLTVSVPAALAGHSGPLTVTATTGGTTSSATVPVQFAPATTPSVSAPALALAPAPAPPALSALVVTGLVFVALLALFLLVTAPLARWGRRRRLDQVEQFRFMAPAGGGGPTPVDVPAEGAVAQAVLGISDRMLKARGLEGRVAVRLERAGMVLRPHEWVVLRGCATVVGLVIGALLLQLPGAVVGALLGWVLAGGYRSWRQARRTKAFADQLPDALQLIIGSLKSGFSLQQSVDAVTRDAPPGPIAVEFGRAMAQTRLGVDVAEALDAVAERTANEDLRWTVMAVRIQRDTGGNLAEVLQSTVDTIRERGRLRRHVRALAAEGRLSAYILIALPILLGLYMVLVRRDYMRPLWTTPLGLAMLIGSAVLMVVGSIWMARWTKVEV